MRHVHMTSQSISMTLEYSFCSGIEKAFYLDVVSTVFIRCVTGDLYSVMPQTAYQDTSQETPSDLVCEKAAVPLSHVIVKILLYVWTKKKKNVLRSEDRTNLIEV